MAKQFYKRKLINYSVKRQLQLRLFVKVLGIAMVGIGLMAAIFYFYSNREINDSYRQFHVHAKNFLDYLFPAVVLSLIAAVVFAVGITLFFPLRIAGPLYRIERDLEERVAEGDLTVRFKLRDGDEIGDLARAVNTSLESIGGKIRRLKASAQQLEAAASGHEGQVGKLAKEINSALDEFKLGV